MESFLGKFVTPFLLSARLVIAFITFRVPPFRSQRQIEQKPDKEFADTEEHDQFAVEGLPAAE